MTNASGHLKIVVEESRQPERSPDGTGEIYATFDRTSGGLTVTSTDPQFELLVDEKFAATATLAAGQIAPERVNRVVDSGFHEQLSFWREGSPGSSTFVLRNFSPDWTLDNGSTAYLASHAGPGERPLTAIFHCPIEGPSLSIAAGQTYCFQALIGLHRATASLRLVFLDGSGNELDTRQASSMAPRLGGRKVSGYEPVAVTATAPSAALHARLEIVKGITSSGEDSFLFFVAPSFCASARPQDHATLLNELPVDLVARHFASGLAGFCHGEIPVPDEALDGGWHDITLRHPASGAAQVVPVSAPETILASVNVLGLEAASLVCNFQAPPGWRSPVALSLWVDGQPAPGKHMADPAIREVRIAVPVFACDGQPHVFELRLGLTGQVLARHAAMGPLSVTPWEALQKYAGLPLPAHLSPLAAYRYRSLADGPGSDSKRALHDILLAGFATPRKSFRPLPFPAADNPEVSIIMPVRDNFDVTYVCLAALLFAATRVRFEVIVVDDGSSDTTQDLPAIAPGVLYVRNAKALGFAGACNAGAARAKGQPHRIPQQ